MSYLDEIKKLIPCKSYYINDFWQICPYDLETLISRRHRNKVLYLHVGMVWARLSGMSTLKAARHFKRHHTTVTYAEKYVLNSLTNPKFGAKEHVEILNQIKKYYESDMSILEVKRTDDIYQDYYASLVNMENKSYQLRNTKI